jgi:TldD protein
MKILNIIALTAVGIGSLQAQQTAPDDAILKAMHDEIDRSRQLRVIGGSDAAPYYIVYSLDDTENIHVSASMGALLNASHNRFRAPNVQVRVGNYDFDDTGHLYSGYYSGSRLDGNWPLDDNYPTLRDCLWLATDRAYKTAIESMGRKRATLNSLNAPVEKLGDFSKAEPVRNVEKVVHKKFDDAGWQSRMVRLSGIFNAYPEVLSSSVDGAVLDGVTYLVNNEGTTLRYNDSLSFVQARAEGQAPDGMVVYGSVMFQALDFDKLPQDAEMRSAITGIAESIRALAKAPAGEAFSGPTLFEPQAAAQLFAQLLGDNLDVPRKPLAEPGRTVNFLPSELETKLGSRILPEWMDVTDDPLQAVWNGKPLAGYSPFDLEGVPGQKVAVVEKGVLKSFLTTRQPIKGFPLSNGHARLSGLYGADTAAITNLFVKTNQATSNQTISNQIVALADLKKKLIDMCRERGKPYGMLVRKLDYPFSEGAGALRAMISSAGQSGGSARPVSPPLLVYRVYADGREELVRGLHFRGLSTRSLRDIVGASQETDLFDYVNNGAPLALLGAGGYLAATSVVAPALLFDEVEFELPREQLPKPAIVPPPTASGN